MEDQSPSSFINVLVVEDSDTMVQLVRSVLEQDPDIRVIGVAHDGIAALEFVRKCKPDVILMDFYLPRLNGLEATRKIMEEDPIPIVILTSDLEDGKAEAFKFLEAGALAALEKPRPGQAFAEEMRRLRESVKTMAGVKLVRRRAKLSQTCGQIPSLKTSGGTSLAAPPATPVDPSAVFAETPPLVSIDLAIARAKSAGVTGSFEVVVIGASTGGPPVIKHLLESLDTNFPLPIVVVQHIARGFLTGLISWLAASTRLPVKEAQNGERLQPGCVYVAPDSVHTAITRQRTISLCDAPPENGVRPAVSYLFRSVAANLEGRAVGILLTGMGKDGAEELKVLKERGALTFAQDKNTCIVYGMPGEAEKLRAASFIVPPSKICEALQQLASRERTEQGEAR